jgi:hypothetical protein
MLIYVHRLFQQAVRPTIQEHVIRVVDNQGHVKRLFVRYEWTITMFCALMHVAYLLIAARQFETSSTHFVSEAMKVIGIQMVYCIDARGRKEV